MDKKAETNFLEPKTLGAIVLVGLVFFLWQAYLTKKYPDYYKSKSSQEKIVETPNATANAEVIIDPKTNVVSVAPTAVSPPGVEETISYSNNLFSFEISSHGMGIKNLTLREFLNRERQPMTLASTESGMLFPVFVEGVATPISFKIEKVSEHTFKGLAKIGSTLITRTMSIDPATGKIGNQISAENREAEFKGIRLQVSEKKFIGSSASIFMPSVEHQEFIVRKDGKTERFRTDSEEEVIEKSFENISMMAISSQYFTSAYVDHSNILPTASLNAPKAGLVVAALSYKALQAQGPFEIKFLTYTGGKSSARLEAIDPDLSEVVDLGMFASIGRILLKILKWSNDVSGNWGWAIVILTLMVRALVLPFNIASYKSMKKMQLIQPQLQSLRERYKQDPAALNRESMALMKDNKVNPIGGCLPMLLQMPIFFALYQVLGQSIELYQAPFIFWIKDLSVRDPVFVLPVLMTVVMYIQQKLTPTTMDPAQAKILQWMPVIFGVFTLGLPSGLTLYIFVSTLFSVVQQKIFMKDRTPAPAVVDIKAQRVH